MSMAQHEAILLHVFTGSGMMLERLNPKLDPVAHLCPWSFSCCSAAAPMLARQQRSEVTTPLLLLLLAVMLAASAAATWVGRCTC
jgi:hypothetical protein